MTPDPSLVMENGIFGAITGQVIYYISVNITSVTLMVLQNLFLDCNESNME